MRKINIEPYYIDGIDSKNKITPLPYNVKGSLAGILFHPDLKIGGQELLLRGKLAEKIEIAENEILIEDSDYAKLKKAVETITGYIQNDIEFVKRVLEAEEVEVTEKR